MTQQTQLTERENALTQIENFEAHYGYDASYMKTMLEQSPEALAVFNAFVPMATFRNKAPIDVYYAAKLTAFRIADCGPCLQLAVRMAQEDKLPAALIEALVFDRGSLPLIVQNVQRFTQACLQNDPEVDALRADLEGEIGEAVLIELSLVIAAAQVFPIVKRAMGHYQSCALVNLEEPLNKVAAP